jgi:hypothetical protein
MQDKKGGRMIKTGLNISDPRVLIGLSLFFVLIGGMAMNPPLSFICFVLAGILGLSAMLKGKGAVRYVAIILLIIAFVLAVSMFSKAGSHLKIYKSKTATGDMK